MLEVVDALEIVLKRTGRLPTESCAVGPELVGSFLAESIIAEHDSPPFDKSLMDGYAVRSADCQVAGVQLQLVNEIAAGDGQAFSLATGQAARIFTGAPIPDGADAVVMQERATAVSDNEVLINIGSISRGTFILRRGTELRADESIFEPGQPLTSAAVGLLATLGKATVQRYRHPRVSILPTGSELLEPGQPMRPGAIYNSNGPMLAAMAAKTKAIPKLWPVAGDDAGLLQTAIQTALEEADILVLSGGVSVGKHDLVAPTLARLGVEIHFHKLRMKPGKPLLFGTLQEKLIFGLPGNPVSSLVGFELFVIPAIRKLMGWADPNLELSRLPLKTSLETENDRPTYHPAVICHGDQGPRVAGLDWFGSGDLRTLTKANCLIVLPEGRVRFKAGDIVPVHQLISG